MGTPSVRFFQFNGRLASSRFAAYSLVRQLSAWREAPGRLFWPPSTVQPCAIFAAFRGDRASCGYTLSSSNFGKIMPEGFGKMLDAIAAFGFATAMDVSGMNIVRIEQQRNFALANWVADCG